MNTATFLEIVLPIAAFIVMGVVGYFALRIVARWYRGADPDHIDAILYTCTGMFMAAQGVFSQDSSYSYVNPNVLFWIKAFCVVFGGGALQLKAFRSGRENQPDKPKEKDTNE